MSGIESKHIADTILQQIGGRQFIAMTGARNFSFDNSGTLSFQLPSRGVAPNRIRIELTPEDVYKVTFYRVRGMEIRSEETHEDIYCEQLRGLIERETGLRTSLTAVYS